MQLRFEKSQQAMRYIQDMSEEMRKEIIEMVKATGRTRDVKEGGLDNVPVAMTDTPGKAKRVLSVTTEEESVVVSASIKAGARIFNNARYDIETLSEKEMDRFEEVLTERV
jgi:hypothetical protein